MSSEKFSVYVERDVRIEEVGYTLGLEPILEHPDIEVTFLESRDDKRMPPGSLAGADAFVSVSYRLDERSLEGADDLKVVTRAGAGYEVLDLEALSDRGIFACHAPQGPTESVAQATLAMFVACAHNLRKYDNIVRDRGFEDRMRNLGFELGSATIGIVGMGLIGSRVVEVVEPFDPEVIVHDPYLDPERADELGVRLVEFDDLLETADIVSLHVPLTPETETMFGEEEFRRMQDHAHLVNTTRGGIYEDAVLARAVREGWIGGAAIDVFEDEPNVLGNPLLELEDQLVTPHIAGLTKQSTDRIGSLMCESILNVMNDDLPISVLNPDATDQEIPAENLSPSFQ